MQSLNRVLAGWLIVGVVAWFVAACGGGASAVLTRVLEARRLASELHVEFIKASEASNRAVMATSENTAASAVAESKRARDVVDRKIDALKPLLESLGYRDDLRYLDGFTTRFEEYKRLDDEILSLAVEGTNVKAQRLSFGPAQEAADAFRKALETAAAHATSNKDRVEALAGRALTAVLEIQVMHAPHIAEADDTVMTRMEDQMTESATAARSAMKELQETLPPDAKPALAAANDALDRFLAINAEIISLSRRNTNVRSLALSFGRKRVVSAECADQLNMLEQALAKHEFSATR
jgi:hypothetical protein